MDGSPDPNLAADTKDLIIESAEEAFVEYPNPLPYITTRDRKKMESVHRWLDAVPVPDAQDFHSKQNELAARTKTRQVTAESLDTNKYLVRLQGSMDHMEMSPATTKLDLDNDPDVSFPKIIEAKKQVKQDIPAIMAQSRERIPEKSMIQQLPTELLVMIMEYLDDASLVCLKCASHYFHAAVNIDIAGLDRCTRWLITARLETDSLPLSSNVNTLACALCKTKRKRVNFVRGLFKELRRIKGTPKCVIPPMNACSVQKFSFGKMLANISAVQ